MPPASSRRRGWLRRSPWPGSAPMPPSSSRRRSWSRRSRCAGSPLDTLLRADALVHRVLDLVDLGHQVGGGDELRRGVAAGDDDVLEAGAPGERADDLVLGDPAVLDRVGELVEQQELVALVVDAALDLLPPCAGAVGRLLEVLGQPGPAVAHLLPLDPAERLRGLRLADLPLAGLDELEDAAAVAARPRAHQHPERGRRLALAVAREDDQQRPVARLAALRVGASEVGHASASRGSRRALAAAASAPARLSRTGPCSPSKITTPAARASRCTASMAGARCWVRPSVTTSASARRSGSLRASARISRSVSASPSASGVAPPVGSVTSASAARSTLPVGASTSCARSPRNVTSATRSRRW